MHVWRTLEEVPAALGPAVVTIGNFDGVHLGHRSVLRRARAAADAHPGSTVVAVTFDPHPFAVLRPEHAPVMLSTLEDRATRLVEAGADGVLALPFDAAMATWSPEQFVDRVVVEVLHACAVVVGANFRFGHKAAGDVTVLRDLGAHRGFDVVPVELDGGPQVWSSTYVRSCLAAGDVAGAAEALGRPYAVEGPVIRGDRRGRELGYPTANVALTAGLAAPADGVYAGWLTRLDTGERYPAAISVGTNPTFEGRRTRRVEAYALDRDDLELYDTRIRVEFVERLRGMVAFDGVPSLLEAMAEDVRRTHAVLGV